MFLHRIASVLFFCAAVLTTSRGWSDTTSAPPPGDFSPFQGRWGIGVSLAMPRMLVSPQDEKSIFSWQMGLGLHCLYHPSPRWSLDLGVELLPTVASQPLPYWSFDTSIMLGTRFHVLAPGAAPRRVHPYIVGAVGLNPTQLTDRHERPLESTLFFEGQMGIGLTIRLPAGISFFTDVRGVFKGRLLDPAQATFASSAGEIPALPGVAGGAMLSIGIVSGI